MEASWASRQNKPTHTATQPPSKTHVGDKSHSLNLIFQKLLPHDNEQTPPPTLIFLFFFRKLALPQFSLSFPFLLFTARHSHHMLCTALKYCAIPRHLQPTSQETNPTPSSLKSSSLSHSSFHIQLDSENRQTKEVLITPCHLAPKCRSI